MPVDVAPREAVAARPPRRPIGGGEASGERERGGEEVADVGSSDGEADVAATVKLAALASEASFLQGFLFSTELFRSFMGN